MSRLRPAGEMALEWWHAPHATPIEDLAVLITRVRLEAIQGCWEAVARGITLESNAAVSPEYLRAQLAAERELGDGKGAA